MQRQDTDNDLNEASVNTLLATEGVDVVARDGRTPLYIAAQKGDEACVNALLAAGANVNAAKRSGATPLFIAAQNGHETCVKALLVAGANVNAAREDGTTSLYIAAQNGHEACVNALVATGANVNAAKRNGATPLFIAAQNGHETCVKALLVAGAIVNAARGDGATPLYIAANTGHEACVKALVAARANVNAPKVGGATPLYIAALQGHFNIVHMLLNEMDSWLISIVNIDHVIDSCSKFQEKLRSVNNDDQLLFLSSFPPRYIIPLANACSRLANPILIPAPLVKQAVHCSRLRRSGFSFVIARVVTARDENNQLMNRAAIMIAISIFLGHPTQSPYLNYAKFSLKDVWVSILNFAVDLSLSRAEWDALAFYVAKEQVKAGLNDYGQQSFWKTIHIEKAKILQSAINETKTADAFKQLLGEQFALLSKDQLALGSNDKKQPPLTNDGYYLLVRRWATLFLDAKGKSDRDQLPVGSAVVDTQEDDLMGFHVMHNQQS